MIGNGPIICDTSGLLAVADADDPDHSRCGDVVTTATGPLVVSPLVVAELDHLLRRRLSDDAAHRFADDVAAAAYELAALTTADIATCVDLDRRYASLGLGLTDAHLVVLADTYGTDQLLSLDERHFRVVRPLRGRSAFRLLPADSGRD